MHKLKIELSKFTIVGAVNFVFTLALFYMFIKAILWNYLISLMLASSLGMIFSYLLNHVWVFKPGHELTFRGCLFKYILAGYLSITLNLIILAYIVERTSFDPFYVQVALIPLVVIINFSTTKFWALRQNDGF